MPLHTKSIHTAIDPNHDGLRILATRYIPRGTPKARYDVWMASLAPSERLLKAFLQDNLTWTEFAAQYKKQLFAEAAVDTENPRIKNHGQKFTLRLLKALTQRQPLTFLCACAEDEPHCHRHLLKAVLESAAV
ncbi:MAG TPA: DUF488 family protein [Prosthecobacter sp.]|nr:DUF488 family protein [Prosthecobacter sp.]